MKRNPFIYGVEASGDAFWDREDERRELKRDVGNCQNVVIFSKRRLGKTSLVKEVLRSLSEREFITAYVDLYPTTSVEDFASRYATAVAHAVRGPVDKALIEIKNLLRSFTPALTVDDEGKPVFTLDFGRKAKEDVLLEEVLEAFPKYCREKNKTGVCVLDEFQQIASYDKKHKLEATLRSHFQTHQNVAYIFLGSKKHLLTDIFSLPNRPFYHSSKMLPLGDMDRKIMMSCIEERFKKTGCKISSEDAGLIIQLSEGHIYYAQRLAHSVWNAIVIKDQIVNSEIIENAFKLIIRENSDYFRSLCDLLTPHQLGALKVAAHLKRGDKIFSNDFLKKHNWQKDSLKQALDALVEKDMLSREEGIYKIDDVFFRNWLII